MCFGFLRMRQILKPAPKRKARGKRGGAKIQDKKQRKITAPYVLGEQSPRFILVFTWGGCYTRQYLCKIQLLLISLQTLL